MTSSELYQALLIYLYSWVAKKQKKIFSMEFFSCAFIKRIFSLKTLFKLAMSITINSLSNSSETFFALLPKKSFFSSLFPRQLFAPLLSDE